MDVKHADDTSRTDEAPRMTRGADRRVRVAMVIAALLVCAFIAGVPNDVFANIALGRAQSERQVNYIRLNGSLIAKQIGNSTWTETTTAATSTTTTQVRQAEGAIGFNPFTNPYACATPGRSDGSHSNPGGTPGSNGNGNAGCPGNGNGGGNGGGNSSGPGSGMSPTAAISMNESTTPEGQSGQSDSPAAPTAPGLPTGLVGENPRQTGKNGGTAIGTSLPPDKFPETVKELTGGTLGTPDKNGRRVSPNGVAVRPNGKDGPRIDIPANGTKPPEIIHFPPGTTVPDVL